MSKNTDILFNLSKTSNEDMFLKIIFNLSKDELDSIDFNVLDQNIISNKMSLKTKLIYNKLLDRNIYDIVTKKILNNSFEADYDDLLYLSKIHPTLRKQILDILCVRTTNSNQYFNFTDELINSNLYDDYTKSVIDGDDLYLKIHFALYFDYLDMMYPNHLELAKLIVKTDECAIFEDGRINHLLRLSALTNDQETLNYIKNVLPFVILKENNESNEKSDINEEEKLLKLNTKLNNTINTFNQIISKKNTN